MKKIITPDRFTGLHAHTGFSTYDGLGYPQEHIDFVLENEMDSFAITEHGHMNSYAHAYLHVKELRNKGVNFKYIPGVEFYVHPDLGQWEIDLQIQRAKKAADKRSKKDDDESAGLTIEDEDATKQNKYLNPVNRRHHLVVLAKNSRGLEKLFSLVSKGYTEGLYRFPRIDYSMLEEACRDSQDLIVSTACIGGPLAWEVFRNFPEASFDGLVPSLLDDEKVMNTVIKGVENAMDPIIDAVGKENFFLEVQFNKLNAQHLVNRALIETSRKNGIDLVATADSHYCRPEYWKDREIYKKLGWLNFENFDPNLLPQTVDDLKCELYPKNAAQMWESFESSTEDYDFYDSEEICNAIERTHDIAHHMIDDVEPDMSIKLPSYVIPENKTAHAALTEACYEGLENLGLDDKDEYVQRLERELGVIGEKEFSEYFLTMKSIFDIASKHMLLGPGRGSSAGSLVCYVLGITQLDPIENELLFERFISKHRAEMPDIDSDVANRDMLLDLLRNEYGDNNVIPISNYNTFKLKSLIKDVSRFYGVPFDVVNDVTRKLEDEVKAQVLGAGDDKNLFTLTLEDSIKHSEKFRNFIDSYPEVKQHLEVLFKQNKALSRHAGGVIISENIQDRMPVIVARGEQQTPWVEGMHYKHLEHFGWIKFDLLGLETLRIIERTIQLILDKEHGIKNASFTQIKEWFDDHMHPSVLDMNDQHVYENIYHAGRWAGVFQCTSRGAQRFFQEGKPRSIIEIATLTSIFRPGPLAAHVHKTYLAAKENPDEVEYEHPLLKEVLGETFGHIIFQEQLMQLGNVIGGLSLDECDKLRKSITKRSMSGKSKAKEEALRLEKLFIKGAEEKGFKTHEAVALFEKMAYFSGYGFNKSHAVSYAIDSYMCAWLLTYYEAEWLCAYMETQAGNPNKRANALSEIKAFGYEIASIDVNHASKYWRPVPGKKLMPSFLTCKGIGDAAIDEIEANRPYKTVEDLLWNENGSWKHSKFNKRALENLIKIDAFKSMDIVGKGKTFESLAQMHKILIEHQGDIKKHGKRTQFKGMDNFKELLVTTHGMQEWTRAERAKNYRELVGTVDINLIISHDVREKLKARSVDSIDEYNDAGLYWFIVESAVQKQTKKRKPYLLLNVSGPMGKRHRMFLWGWDPERNSAVEPDTALLAEVSKSDFGFATRISKVREISKKRE